MGQRPLFGRRVQIQMGEDLADHGRILDTGDDPDGTAADTAGFDVDIEYAPSSKADVGVFIP